MKETREYYNIKCKYFELHGCPYRNLTDNKVCAFLNVRLNGGDFGERFCMQYERNLNNWTIITPTSLPPKDTPLIVRNIHGEVYEFIFYGYCNVKISAEEMVITEFKIARI